MCSHIDSVSQLPLQDVTSMGWTGLHPSTVTSVMFFFTRTQFLSIPEILRVNRRSFEYYIFFTVKITGPFTWKAEQMSVWIIHESILCKMLHYTECDHLQWTLVLLVIHRWGPSGYFEQGNNFLHVLQHPSASSFSVPCSDK